MSSAHRLCCGDIQFEASCSAVCPCLFVIRVSQVWLIVPSDSWFDVLK